MLRAQGKSNTRRSDIPSSRAGGGGSSAANRGDDATGLPEPKWRFVSDEFPFTCQSRGISLWSRHESGRVATIAGTGLGGGPPAPSAVISLTRPPPYRVAHPELSTCELQGRHPIRTRTAARRDDANTPTSSIPTTGTQVRVPSSLDRSRTHRVAMPGRPTRRRG